MTYRIEFEGAAGGRQILAAEPGILNADGSPMSDFKFDNASDAITEAYRLQNDVNNPGWIGTFHAINPQGKRI